MLTNRFFHLAALSALCIVLPGGAVNATCAALPYTLTNGTLADAGQVMGNFNTLAACTGAAGATGSVQVNAGSGGFGAVTLSDGQLPIGSTGNPPVAASITGGAGISVSNGPGAITISATGGTTTPFNDPASIAQTKPVASAFTLNNSTGNTGTLTDLASRGVSLNTPTGSAFVTTMEQSVLSSTEFTVTAQVYPVGFMNGNWFWGLAVKDSAGKYVGFGFRNLTPVSYFKFPSINGAAIAATTTGIVNAQNPVWVRLQLASGNFVFSFSFDGETFLPGWTVSATDYLGSTLSSVGVLVLNNASGHAIPLDVLSWTNTSP